jgi:hypothetical protein
MYKEKQEAKERLTKMRWLTRYRWVNKIQYQTDEEEIIEYNN